MDNAAPAQGDVRLIDVKGMNATTQTCDHVHAGGVEFFNAGRWGRICFRELASFNVDVKVICRQLGFPFGSLIDFGEVRSSRGGPIINSDDYVDYGEAGELVWATDIQCTGKEERLGDCFFPQDFGSPQDPMAPQPAGIPSADCSRSDGSILAVACRQFEIEGALPMLRMVLSRLIIYSPGIRCMHREHTALWKAAHML